MDTELAEYVLDVIGHGLRPDDELHRDVRGPSAPGKQSQHLGLSRREITFAI
jgi:hypothetical protein